MLLRQTTALPVVGFMVGHGIVGADSKSSRRMIGRGCVYHEYPGKAVVTRIEKTERSKRQGTVTGGPVYEGCYVLFRFGRSSKIKQPRVQRWANRNHRHAREAATISVPETIH